MRSHSQGANAGSQTRVTNGLSSELHAQPSSLIFKVLYLLRIAESVLDTGCAHATARVKLRAQLCGAESLLPPLHGSQSSSANG